MKQALFSMAILALVFASISQVTQAEAACLTRAEVEQGMNEICANITHIWPSPKAITRAECINYGIVAGRGDYPLINQVLSYPAFQQCCYKLDSMDAAATIVNQADPIEAFANDILKQTAHNQRNRCQ